MISSHCTNNQPDEGGGELTEPGCGEDGVRRHQYTHRDKKKQNKKQTKQVTLDRKESPDMNTPRSGGARMLLAVGPGHFFTAFQNRSLNGRKDEGEVTCRAELKIKRVGGHSCLWRCPFSIVQALCTADASIRVPARPTGRVLKVTF